MLDLNSSSSNSSFHEEDQVLAERNDTQTDFEHQCLHELVEARVESNPNAIALICQEQQLTYAQLNSRANQLAHYLGNLGVEKESLVGLYMERSIDMVVKILGILKTGGAYVRLMVRQKELELSLFTIFPNRWIVAGNLFLLVVRFLICEPTY